MNYTSAVTNTYEIGFAINSLGANNTLTIIAPDAPKSSKPVLVGKTMVVGSPFPITLGDAKNPQTVMVKSNLLANENTLEMWYSVGKDYTSIEYMLYPKGGVPVVNTLMSWKNGEMAGMILLQLDFKLSKDGGILIVGTMDVEP